MILAYMRDFSSLVHVGTFVPSERITCSPTLPPRRKQSAVIDLFAALKLFSELAHQ